MQITVKFDNGVERIYGVREFADDEMGKIQRFHSMDDAVEFAECEEYGSRFESANGSYEFARVERPGAHYDLIVFESDTGRAGWANEI